MLHSFSALRPVSWTALRLGVLVLSCVVAMWPATRTGAMHIALATLYVCVCLGMTLRLKRAGMLNATPMRVYRHYLSTNRRDGTSLNGLNPASAALETLAVVLGAIALLLLSL